jgi:hypothetical protein
MATAEKPVDAKALLANADDAYILKMKGFMQRVADKKVEKDDPMVKFFFQPGTEVTENDFARLINQPNMHTVTKMAKASSDEDFIKFCRTQDLSMLPPMKLTASEMAMIQGGEEKPGDWGTWCLLTTPTGTFATALHDNY